MSRTTSLLQQSPASRPTTRVELERLFALKAERFRRANPGLLAWSEAHRLEEGGPLDFDTFPFQRELYDAFGDQSLATVDVMKSGQCGISAAAVSLALYAGDAWQANVLYVLPGAADAYDFSDSRVAVAIEGSPYLAARFAGGTANKGLKRIGDAWLYFRGSVSEKKALSIPADVLILDEYDRLDQRNIPAFRKRLGSPKSLKLERRFSNPSWPEVGIHKLFTESDQHEWLIRCGCRHEAAITYEPEEGSHHVDERRELRVCGRCSKPLHREAVASGRWVAAKPDIGRRGYHVSKLIVPDQGVAELVEEHHRTDESSLQAHYNFDLGLPYSPKGGSLSREIVDACRRRYVPPDVYTGPDWVTAGVDVGRVLHVRISRWMDSGRAAPLFIGTVVGFGELAELFERYQVNFGLIDERPEERKAREFAAAHPGRVLLVRWAGREQRQEVVVDSDNGLVIVRRTWACDQTVAAFEAQLRLLPEHVPRDYMAQVTAVYRTFEETMAGQKVAIYVQAGRADDFFFAETYDLLAKLARGGPAAEGAGPPPETIRQRSRRARG